MKYQKINALKFGIAAAIISGVLTFLSLLTGIEGIFKQYAELINMWMVAIYGFVGYTGLNFVSAILGSIYVAIDTFVLCYLFIWIYNKIL